MTNGAEIVVTGTRLTRYFNNMNATFMWGSAGYDDPGSSSQPVPPECTCGMEGDANAQLASVTNEEAAKVIRDILAQANQRMEYGSVIYIGADGTVTHNPLRSSTDFRTQLDFSGVPKNADGTTDFSRVLAVVHSHPQYLPNADGTPGHTNYFDSSDPDYLLYPSDRDDMEDDWDFYDRVAGYITADGGDASSFSLYIAGFNGTSLELNKYFGNDAHTTTAASGETVDKNYVSPVYSCPLHGG